MAQRVMVATDGGPASLAAIDWVIHFAEDKTIDVDVVTVEETDQMPFGSDPREYRAAYLAHLAEGESRLSNHHGVSSVTRTLLSGVASREIADASQIADMLVVGSNPVAAPAADLRSSLALRLAPRSDCPLVVVPAAWQSREGAVVVGAEDDGSSDTAIDFAAHEAATTGRRLLVVHAWLPAPPFTSIGRHRESEFPTLKALHQASLDASVARARLIASRATVTGILQFCPASAALLTAATGASLLVVGSHRHGIVADTFLGGSSRKLLSSAACPIAVVSSDRIVLDAPRGLVWEGTA